MYNTNFRKGITLQNMEKI